jgi:Na+/H+ antiporter NhaA
MEFIAPFFAFFGLAIFLGSLIAIVITVLVILKKQIPTTDKLLMIIMVWIIPVIGSIVTLYMLFTQYRQEEEEIHP